MNARRTLMPGAALVIVGATVGAHVVAGGALDVWSAFGVLVLAVGLGAGVERLVRGRLPLLAAVVLLAQPVLHVVLGGGASVSDAGHGAHHHGTAPGGSVAEQAGGAHGGGAMLSAHLVAALITTVLLRWGVRWLRTMPALGQALVVPPPSVVRPVAPLTVAVPVAPVLAVTHVAVLSAWGSRGPPA